MRRVICYHYGRQNRTLECITNDIALQVIPSTYLCIPSHTRAGDYGEQKPSPSGPTAHKEISHQGPNGHERLGENTFRRLLGSAR